MMTFIRCAVVALMLTPAPVAAQDFDAGLEAARKGDFATALREWRPLAEQGDMDAQHSLGLMYHNGDGVVQDHAEAVRWFGMAAEQGRADAQYNLGVMYRTGQGLAQDYVEAINWYRLAAEQGLARALYNLETIYANPHRSRRDHRWPQQLSDS